MAVEQSTPTDPDYGKIRRPAAAAQHHDPGPEPGRRTTSSPTPNVANALLSLRRGGNAEVELGNLLTLPVAGGLLYVEPVYARATEGASYPMLRKVLVSYGEPGRIADTLQEALGRLLRRRRHRHRRQPEHRPGKRRRWRRSRVAAERWRRQRRR